MNEENVIAEIKKYEGDDILEKLERLAYTAIFEDCRYNQTKCAARLNVNRGTCRKKLKNAGLLP